MKQHEIPFCGKNFGDLRLDLAYAASRINANNNKTAAATFFTALSTVRSALVSRIGLSYAEVPRFIGEPAGIRLKLSKATQFALNSPEDAAALSGALLFIMMEIFKIVPPFTLGLKFEKDGAAAIEHPDIPLATLEEGGSITPNYLRSLTGGSTEPVLAGDSRLKSLQVGQEEGGYGTENDWFICDAVTGTITAKINAVAPPTPGTRMIRREYIAIEDGVQRRAYAFTFLGFTVTE